MFRVSATALGVAVALLCAEVCLRLLGYRGDSERDARAFDPVYSNVRNDSWIFDFEIDLARHHRVDLRGQRIDLPKPVGLTRVLFVGDSVTEGAFLPLQSAFPAVFGSMIKQSVADSRFEVINAGVWGMTTIDEYFLLKDKLLPLSPDVVVLGLFLANDVNFNLGHPQRELRYTAPRLIDIARRHSALAHFLFLQALTWNVRLGLVPESRFARTFVPLELSLVDEYGLHMLSYPAGELALYMRRPSRTVEQAWTLLRSVLARFAELAEKEGFRLRVLLIPSPSTVTRRLNILHYPNLLQELHASGIDVSVGQLDFALPLRRAKRICEELDLACVDPMPELAPLGLSAFFPGDEHPSREGHRALARALWESR